MVSAPGRLKVISRDPRPLLPHRRQRRLGRPARRRRRAADPASDQGRRRATFARETRAALAVCRKAGATLVVNDDWRAAIDEGADWVHLGQEDLDTADLAAIRRKGLRLGVSTWDEAELERGLAVDPDYVAFGPVFPTISKDLAVAPLGSKA